MYLIPTFPAGISRQGVPLPMALYVPRGHGIMPLAGGPPFVAKVYTFGAAAVGSLHTMPAKCKSKISISKLVVVQSAPVTGK